MKKIFFIIVIFCLFCSNLFSQKNYCEIDSVVNATYNFLENEILNKTDSFTNKKFSILYDSLKIKPIGFYMYENMCAGACVGFRPYYSDIHLVFTDNNLSCKNVDDLLSDVYLMVYFEEKIYDIEIIEKIYDKYLKQCRDWNKDNLDFYNFFKDCTVKKIYIHKPKEWWIEGLKRRCTKI